MTRLDYIYETLKDIKGKTPVLLIGGAMSLFKMIYKGHIYKIYNTEDAKELISNFYNVEYNKPIIVEDISLLYRDNILLKLVEEIKLPLILLASEDNISSSLQSRVKTTIKYPKDLDFKCDFTSILDAQEYIDERNLSGNELDSYIASHCPDLAVYYKMMEVRKNKDKLIQIIGGLEKNENN